MEKKMVYIVIIPFCLSIYLFVVHKNLSCQWTKLQENFKATDMSDAVFLKQFTSAAQKVKAHKPRAIKRETLNYTYTHYME